MNSLTTLKINKMIWFVGILLITMAPSCSQKSESDFLPPADMFKIDDLGDGWKKYERQADKNNFSIKLPSSWRVTGFDSDSIDRLQEEINSDHQLNKELNGLDFRILKSRLKLFGFEQSGENNNDFLTHIRVLQEPIPSDMAFESFVQTNHKTIPENATCVRINVEINRLELIKCSVNSVIPGTEGESFVNYSYLFLGEDHAAYIISMNTSLEQEKALASTFDKIARSFQKL